MHTNTLTSVPAIRITMRMVAPHTMNDSDTQRAVDFIGTHDPVSGS